MNNLVELKKEELREVDGGNFLGMYLGIAISVWYNGDSLSAKYANFVVKQMSVTPESNLVGEGTTTHR